MRSLYIHIPFCEQKCFYCSFVVSIGQKHRVDLYLDSLGKEARRYRGTEVQTVFVGGGTPTIMSEVQMEKLLSIINECFRVVPGGEWTVEANPESVDCHKLKLLQRGGVNRLSLGIQSLNDKYLKYLGRNHNAQTARRAYQKIRKAGFKNISVDMMLSFPGQSMREIERDIDEMAQLGSDHISLYTLTIERNSRFFSQKVQLSDDQSQAGQYGLVCDFISRRGYAQYEVSNFAKLSKESIHNINYWRGGHYIGLGMGAHSHVKNRRYWNVSKLQDYIAKLQRGDSIEEGHEHLTDYEEMVESVLFGLRMNEGVNIRAIEKRYGCFLKDEQRQTIDYLIDGGFLIRDHEIVKADAKGRLVLDEICAQLI